MIALDRKQAHVRPIRGASARAFRRRNGRVPEAGGEPAPCRRHVSLADRIGHDDRINLNLVRLVGADRVLLGSDYCFDMGLTDPVASVERLNILSNTERDQIKGGTAARLLRLKKCVATP